VEGRKGQSSRNGTECRHDLLDCCAVAAQVAFTARDRPESGKKARGNKTAGEADLGRGTRARFKRAVTIAKDPDVRGDSVIECAEAYDFADLFPARERAALNLN